MKTPMQCDPDQAGEFLTEVWRDSILPALHDYIRIPNRSPAFDPDWEAAGHMERAARLLEDWAKTRNIEGLELEVVRLPGRTPLLYLEVPGSSDSTVLLYGHYDKQPEMTGWSEGLAPWEPVLRDGRLYGRGGADDGYSLFASLVAVELLGRQQLPHARIVILIEGCEESGSFDLPHYVDHLEQRIGKPELVVCLDSGAGNYDQLWATTSLRGNIVGQLDVSLLREGVHSGDGSGVVASSFRVARQLLDRIEDPNTGEIRLPELHVEIPAARRAQAEVAAQVLGEEVWRKFPLQPGTQATSADLTDLILNRTWRPALSVTGAGGLPAPASAGNVLRPETSLVLSMRTPPTCDVGRAAQALKKALEADPPYGAQVRFEVGDGAAGWDAPALVNWLEEATERASRNWFGAGAVYMGEGGTIPFMGMLGDKFPGAQFLITGVLGPGSNAHGPNEFLHVEMGRRLTGCVADVLAQHYHSRA